MCRRHDSKSNRVEADMSLFELESGGMMRVEKPMARQNRLTRPQGMMKRTEYMGKHLSYENVLSRKGLLQNATSALSLHCLEVLLRSPSKDGIRLKKILLLISEKAARRMP